MVMEGVWVVGRQNADIADTLHLGDLAMATIFWLSIYGYTLAPPGEYDWAVHVRRRCGLMSNYFDHLFSFDTAYRRFLHGVTVFRIDEAPVFDGVLQLFKCRRRVKSHARLHTVLSLYQKFSLYFAWVVDDAKCIVVTRVCVSACRHYCTEPDVSWEC